MRPRPGGAGHGRVRPGGHPLRAADRPAAVPGGETAGDAEPGADAGAGAAPPLAAEAAAGPGDDLLEVPGEGPAPTLRPAPGPGRRPGSFETWKSRSIPGRSVATAGGLALGRRRPARASGLVLAALLLYAAVVAGSVWESGGILQRCDQELARSVDTQFDLVKRSVLDHLPSERPRRDAPRLGKTRPEARGRLNALLSGHIDDFNNGFGKAENNRWSTCSSWMQRDAPGAFVPRGQVGRPELRGTGYWQRLFDPFPPSQGGSVSSRGCSGPTRTIFTSPRSSPGSGMADVPRPGSGDHPHQFRAGRAGAEESLGARSPVRSTRAIRP